MGRRHGTLDQLGDSALAQNQIREADMRHLHQRSRDRVIQSTGLIGNRMRHPRQGCLEAGRPTANQSEVDSLEQLSKRLRRDLGSLAGQRRDLLAVRSRRRTYHDAHIATALPRPHHARRDLERRQKSSDFLGPTAWQKSDRERSFGIVEPRFPFTVAPREREVGVVFHERMAHRKNIEATRLEIVRFERQDGPEAIDAAAQVAQAPGAPRPELGRHEIEHGQPQTASVTRQGKIEAGEIDGDDDGDARTFEVGTHPSPRAPKHRQTGSDFAETHHRQFCRRLNDLGPGQGQRRPTQCRTADARRALTERRQQRRAVTIGAGFAATQENMRRVGGGPTRRDVQRTIPRSDLRMKAIRSSIYLVNWQSLAMRSIAWLTFRPDR